MTADVHPAPARRSAEPDDGFEEVRGQVHRVRHALPDRRGRERCDGWVLAGFQTLRERHDEESEHSHPTEAYPAYRPCEVCRPERYAAWREGRRGPARAVESPPRELDYA